MPAKVQGSWSLTGLPGNGPISLDLSQRFQIVEGVVKSNGVEQALIEPKLSGENFSFEFVDAKGLQQKVELKVAGDQMAGQASSPQSSAAVSASRLN